MIWFLLACRPDDKSPDCQMRVSAEVEDLEITWPDDSCGTLKLNAEVKGTEGLSLRLQIDGTKIKPIVQAGSQGGEVEAVIFQGDYELHGNTPIRLWKQGYQSWWWSGVTDLNPVTLDNNGLPEVGGDGNGTSASEETPFSSWWNGLVGKSDGQNLIIGALSTNRFRCWSAFSENELWAVWGGRADKIKLDPNETLELDPIVIQSGTDAFALHRSYAEEVADHLGVTVNFEKPPTGWATWYTFYEDINEDIIQANLDAAIDLRDREGTTPIEVFQIDDGWQKHWGEWEANEEFPSGMAKLAEDISAAGFTAGLWMAPFYVSTEAQIYSENAEWWVRDDSGFPILFSNFGDNNYAIIDVTHPEAAEWMQSTVAAKKAEGWDYFKLDFLYAGAQSGQRQEAVTGMEAYHIGMALLRDAVGDGMFLACGAPMLPSVGYADAFRTGADIGFGFDPGPRHEYLRWQARATASRSWQNGIWWWIDPDQILLRAPFSAAERNGSLVANVISGGSWLLGDDISTLSFNLLEDGMASPLVDTRGLVGEPLNPLSSPSGPDFGPVSEWGDPDDSVPIRWRLSDGTIAFLNMSENSIDIPAPAGREYFSQEQTAEGELRTLVSGQGELWLSEDLD